MSKRHANRNRKLLEAPTEPNAKLAPLATVIALKLMSNAPLRVVVDRTQPDDIYSAHPPTDEQIVFVGTMPPSHVFVIVKFPDVTTTNVTSVNV